MSDFHSAIHYRVAIVGGAGRVGLPLGLLIVHKGHTVTLVDSNTESLEKIANGDMPFLEQGAEELLAAGLASGRLRLTSVADSLAGHDVIVVTIGTPVDEYLDPDVRTFDRVLDTILSRTSAGQLLMIRSTVFPGVTDRVGRLVAERELAIDVAYCPERIAEGQALRELTYLPQLVSGCTDSARRRATEFFQAHGAKVNEL